MIRHELIQGAPEWHEHRRTHFNASDAPAMMGVSKYKSRQELIRDLATGITPEVTPELQRLFDEGHRTEALARPLAEEFVGEELYPVVGSEGLLSASYDGLTMLDDDGFEHKMLNAELREAFDDIETIAPEHRDVAAGRILPLAYQMQLEQQIMIAKCNRILFMATKWDGNVLLEKRHCWYYPNPELAAKIEAGWRQLEADVAAYVPTEKALAPVPQVVITLPAVSVQVSGSIAVRNNFAQFETALRDFIENRLIKKPESDQDFADLGEQIRALERAEAALDAAEAQMLSQVEAVDQAKRSKDMLLKLARDNRLLAEKLLAARKDQIKVEQVQRGREALAEHVKNLNERLGKPYMPMIAADFAAAIKGKRTVASLKDAVDTLLAQNKINASTIADRIQINLKTLSEKVDHSFLFADEAQIVQKEPEDLKLLVQSRITEHDAKEAKRLADERESIRLEEEAKAQKAHEAARAAVAAIRFPTPEPEVFAELPLVEANNAVKAEIALSAPVVAPAVRQIDPIAYTVRSAPAAVMSVSEIQERFGAMPITGDFIASLGFNTIPQPKKAGKFFLVSDWPRICDALIAYIQKCKTVPFQPKTKAALAMA